MNILDAVTPKLLAQGLLALRENAVMPMMVNRGYEAEAGMKGSTIDVPIPSAITVQDVVAAPTPPDTQDVAPTSVPVPLDQWKEAPFYLTDKDMLTAMDGTIPMHASEAIKALANTVDIYLLNLGKRFYGFHGIPGTTPFFDGTTRDATRMKTILDKQLAPADQTARYLLFDPETEGAALNVRAFQDASFGVGGEAIMSGNITRRLGFGMMMDQNVLTHVAGTAAQATVTCVGNHVPGSRTVSLASTTNGATLNDGDIITFANHAQTYAVAGNYTLGSAGTDVVVAPGLQVAVNGSTAAMAVAVADTHVMNLAFHRDAIAFATRPLQMGAQGLGVISSATQDPISGLTLRLEITHEHKRTRFSYDMLYGAAVIRPEFGARLAG